MTGNNRYTEKENRLVSEHDTATQTNASEIRTQVPAPPKGWDLLRWYGPGLLWMLSSVGSGSVLFTPRVGSRYGFSLLWAALLVIFAQWVMIREVGRYTVVTGRTILDGFSEVPGPRGWAVWTIFLPQVVAAVVTIAGIAALAGSALMIALPGSQAFYAPALIVVSIVLVVAGRYKKVEQVSAIMAGILVLTAVTAAIMVFDTPDKVLQGLAPSIPENLDFYFVLPWLGFILAGAAGVLWYSYWVAERGFGGTVTEEKNEGQTPADERGESMQSRSERIERLRSWMRVMSTTGAIGVGGGALVVVSFLILGAEVLGPQGIVPEGIRVAEELTNLLSKVWGTFGYWVLLIGIMVALWGTLLADQDGWGRMFADATLLLRKNRKTPNPDKRVSWLARFLASRERLKNAYAIGATAVLPLIVFWMVRDPVAILSVGGIIAAVHTPVVVFLTQYVNKKQLPKEMQPGWLMSAAMIASGLLFLAFAVFYLLDLAGVRPLQATQASLQSAWSALASLTDHAASVSTRF